MTRWTTLDRLALRMVRIVERADLIEILACRNAAHRKRGSDQIAGG
jgi:hypothetical protein